jgi:predicted metal-dependent enzyme (double-stranded beta helix superfamily)
MPFDLASFIDECLGALKTDAPQKSVRELAARAVSDCEAVLEGLGEPAKGGIQTLYRSPELTVLNVIWAPKMTIFPHNHTMWAVIGIYGGREDNIFWRRCPGATDGRVEAAGARSLCDRDAIALGADVIHSVTNPISRLTGAIHIYGGDFFNPNRSEWDPETLTERRCDVDRLVRQFEEDNRRWFATS